MRHLLVDAARRQGAAKHGGGLERGELREDDAAVLGEAETVLAGATFTSPQFINASCPRDKSKSVECVRGTHSVKQLIIAVAVHGGSVTNHRPKTSGSRVCAGFFFQVRYIGSQTSSMSQGSRR